jgi:4-aminobutyrate aminotransferase-like enzyme/catechol 2,3-dioxygenase-like lactoylglutathione lyase family enzyme
MTYKITYNQRLVKPKETRNVTLRGSIPCNEDYRLMQELVKNEPSSMHNQLPILWSNASEHTVEDSNRNRWIDFTSGIFTANVGHGNPAVTSAIQRTVNKGLCHSYYYPTAERAELTRELLKLTPWLDKVLLLTTGSEAVEAALKMAVIRGKADCNTRCKIVAFENSFHGKTLGSQFAGGKPKEKEWIGWSHPNVVHIPFPYPWVLEEKGMTGAQFFEDSTKSLHPYQIAAFITEPYQGWCAAFMPADYAQAMKKFCELNNALLIVDEVQAGFGRTGKMFGFEHLGVQPDIIVCGKGISSSLPLSAVITRQDIVGDNQSFNSTHGGNPVAVAASVASIREIRRLDLVKASAKLGDYLGAQLFELKNKYPSHIKRICGSGLLAAVFIESGTTESNEDFVDRLIEKAFFKGLVSVRTGSGTLKLGPPLCITQDALQEGLDILEDSLVELIDEQQEPIHITGTRHVGFNVTSIAEALPFYTELLGGEVVWEGTEARSPYIAELLAVGIEYTLKMVKVKLPTGLVVELLEGSAYIPSSRSTRTVPGSHLAIQVSNIQDAYSKVKARGYRVLSAPLRSTDGGAMVFMALDPSDNRIEFVEPLIEVT